MHICNAVVAVIVILQLDPVSQCTQVVAQSHYTGGLDAREYNRFLLIFHDIYSSQIVIELR